jgi:hypothetical protein
MRERPSMQYSIFAVDHAPYCIWDEDLRARNLEFLKWIDPEYFTYLATAHTPQLNERLKKRASIALRAGYHHGIETIFSLLCATLQAPDCLMGWIHKCKTEQLRKVVNKITKKEPVLNKLGIEVPSWNELSARINRFSSMSREEAEAYQGAFARFWSKLASELLNEANNSEYNSIKHGFRALSGGFDLAVGEHDSKEKIPEKFHPLGGSIYGSSFFSLGSIKNSPLKKDPHMKISRVMVNWDPINMAYALNLISMSMKNIVSYLKILNGADPREVPFSRPENLNDFEKPWENKIGVVSGKFDLNVYEEQIDRFSAKEMIEFLENYKPGKANG